MRTPPWVPTLITERGGPRCVQAAVAKHPGQGLTRHRHSCLTVPEAGRPRLGCPVHHLVGHFLAVSSWGGGALGPLPRGADLCLMLHPKASPPDTLTLLGGSIVRILGNTVTQTSPSLWGWGTLEQDLAEVGVSGCFPSGQTRPTKIIWVCWVFLFS